MNSDDIIEYFEYCKIFNEIIKDLDYDCIVSLKRSGFILGVYLSNQNEKPLYSSTELKNIPVKYKNILLIDDKVCTGKSIKKVKNRLENLSFKVVTGSLFIETEYVPDIYLSKIKKNTKMFYEKRIKPVKSGNSIIKI